MGLVNAVGKRLEHPGELGGKVLFRRALLLCWTLALVASSCGGDDSPATVESDATGTAGGDERADPDGEGGFTTSSADAELQIGDDGRPDWLPPWVLLPEGLDITLAFDDGATGESAVTGFIIGADPQELYDDALFMVQAGGYIIGEEQQTSGVAFNADHSDDGTLVRFAAIAIDSETVQWSLEFSAPVAGGEPGDTDSAAGNPSYYEIPGVLTVNVAGDSFTLVGTCSVYGVAESFLSEDGWSSFAVDSEDPPLASAALSREVDGVTETWSIPISVEGAVERTERTEERLHFEGKMTANGSELIDGVIDVLCG